MEIYIETVIEAEKTPLINETKYYIPSISESKLYEECIWRNDEKDAVFLTDKLIHLTKRNAILHALHLIYAFKDYDN